MTGPLSPFDRLGRSSCAARLVIGAWAVLIALALPFAPQAPGALSAGGFINEGLETARAKTLLEAELGAPPSALVVVLSSPDLEAGTPEFELAVRGGPRHPRRTARREASSRTCCSRARYPHDRPPRPMTSSCSTSSPDDSPRGPADPACTRCVTLPGFDRGAGRTAPRSMATSRRSDEQDLQRSEIISLPLAAPRAPAGVRIGRRGRRPARRGRGKRARRPGGRLPDRVVHADEHLRGLTWPRSLGLGPRRRLPRLLHDKPVPRRAGQAPRGLRRGARRRGRPDHGGDRPAEPSSSAA